MKHGYVLRSDYNGDSYTISESAKNIVKELFDYLGEDCGYWYSKKDFNHVVKMIRENKKKKYFDADFINECRKRDGFEYDLNFDDYEIVRSEMV